MCGIFGLWHSDGKPIDLAAVQWATTILRHRGPDDEGYLLINTKTGRTVPCGGPHTDTSLNLPLINTFYDEVIDWAFGFRRLAILDLSPAGHQPMITADNHFWIVFNGEIYNYLELRSELAGYGYKFRTGTDTEVVLYAYAEWGEACLERFNGMWAFALWDNRQRRLFCARDRFGIKPFYYVWDGHTFAFASEIKALLCLPGFERRPNDTIIYDYLSSGLLDHSAETFFADVQQLPPAHCLTVYNGRLNVRRYWDLDPHHKIELADDAAYAQAFYELFEDAVRIHLRSDVPIGTCLSGGLDSSSIVCVANRLLFSDQVVKPELVGSQQKTFSSCFDAPRFDERQHIERVLKATGAEPNYTFPSPAKLREDLTRLVWHQDEPFNSTSIFAQWCVMELVAQRGVKVLLDGQGGDELLSGYHTYFAYFWSALARQGRWWELWREVWAYHRLFDSLPWRELLRIWRPYAPAVLVALARRFKKRGPTSGTLGLNLSFAKAFHQRVYRPEARSADPFYNFLYDTLMRSSLPGLLHYEDRNSMAHSIEARVPFLDYRLVEYVFSLPAEQKIKNATTKLVLRNAMQGVLPELVRTRTDKMGFVTPERMWLSNELYDWIRDIIESESFRARDYFDVAQIRRALAEHDAGQRDLTFIAWRWINLELWLRRFLDADQQSIAWQNHP